MPFFTAIALLILLPVALLTYYTSSEGSSELVTAGIVVLILAVIIAGAIISIYVIYKWIDRRNKHFARIQRMYNTIINIVETVDPDNPDLARMKNIYEEARFREGYRNPVLWIILNLIPYDSTIVWLYMLHFLTKDFREHEEREIRFLRALSDTLKRKGITFMPPSETIPDRNTILYAILTLLTFGIFGLYWIYIVTSDPNKHFQQHRILDRRIVDVLKQL